MNGSIKVKTLAVTISLLAGSQSALALTPWVNGTPDVLVYTSGGAAQDQAYAAAVAKKLAAPGSLDTFGTKMARPSVADLPATILLALRVCRIIWQAKKYFLKNAHMAQLAMVLFL